MPCPKIISCAIEAAIEASRAIQQVYFNDFESHIKVDGSPVTEADLISSNVILNHLNKTGIPIINEEVEHQDYALRKQWKQCWCVDPLDGTKEFIKKNGQFAVNIALIENGTPVFGIITSPINETLMFGGKDGGVFYTSFENYLTKVALTPLDRITGVEPLKIIASNSHHSQQVLDYVENLPFAYEFIRKGSSLKFMDLAHNTAQIYPRFNPTMEWDIAAGQCILEALGGGVFCTETKLPLTYNKESLVNPPFIAISDLSLSQWI